MKKSKTLLVIAIGASALASTALVAANASHPGLFLNGNVQKYNTAINVTTPYSLILGETWGYKGENKKIITSSLGNPLEIGFSNGEKFGHSASKLAFSTTEEGLYLFNNTRLSGVSEVYIKGTSSNEKTGVKVYGHHYSQTGIIDDSQVVMGELNTLIRIKPTNYIAIEFLGIDNIESVEIGYACSEVNDPIDHLTPGGKHKKEDFYQSITGLKTDLAVGTAVNVEMDISITGTYDEWSKIYWVNKVWTTEGGEINADDTTIHKLVDASKKGWQHISFVAYVANYEALRVGVDYQKVNTSSYGNAVYLVSMNKSVDSFNFKNVEISKSDTLVTAGINKGFYQNITGLKTNLEVGTDVKVEMDVYTTGTYGEYSQVYWVNDVYTQEGGEANNDGISASIKDLVTNGNGWHHISFEATVRNFGTLRVGLDYPIHDTSSYGNAVYLISMNETTASFSYRNVKIDKIDNGTLVEAHELTPGSGNYTSILPIPTTLEAGTPVEVSMNIAIRSSEGAWINLKSAPETWATPIPTPHDFNVSANTDLIANNGKWRNISFSTKVLNEKQINFNDGKTGYTHNFEGNYILLYFWGHASSDYFRYKDDSIKVSPVETLIPAGNNGNTSNPYYQNIIGLKTELAVGTNVTVEMDACVTGTYDEWSQLYWVNDVYTQEGGEANNEGVNTSIKDLVVNGSGWHHISFEATVRDFGTLRVGLDYPIHNTSSYGNAVYIISMNKSETTFNYKNVTITAK